MSLSSYPSAASDIFCLWALHQLCNQCVNDTAEPTSPIPEFPLASLVFTESAGWVQTPLVTASSALAIVFTESDGVLSPTTWTLFQNGRARASVECLPLALEIVGDDYIFITGKMVAELLLLSFEHRCTVFLGADEVDDVEDGVQDGQYWSLRATTLSGDVFRVFYNDTPLFKVVDGDSEDE